MSEWTLAEFEVAKPWRGQMVRIPITGHTKGGLAVHQSVTTREGGWVLSHLATGAKVFGKNSSAEECRIVGDAVLVAVPFFSTQGQFGDAKSVDKEMLAAVKSVIDNSSAGFDSEEEDADEEGWPQ